MKYYKKEELDPNSAKGTIQMEQIALREAKKQHLPPDDSEDRRYLNETESRAIRDQEFVIRPIPEQKKKCERGSNKKCRISYGLLNIFWILLLFLLFLAGFYICKTKMSKK